jgi:nucleoside-diphosphate-sugar epimerase
MPHILITGAAGFLGSEVVRQALGAGFAVTATDRIASAKFPGIDLAPADILDFPSLAKVFHDVDRVCHVAGLAHVFNKSEIAGAPFHAVNVEGTENVAQAALGAGVRHFIFVSSVSVYGCIAQAKDEGSECCPEGPYAQSKLQAERRLIGLCQNSGMHLTILRLATLYGEGDPGNVARLMRTIDRGRFVWLGDGANRKILLHREDAARACLAVIQGPASGVNIYNVSGPSCTMRDVVQGLAGALGAQIHPLGIPVALVRGMSGLFSRLPISRLRALGGMAQKWLADDVVDSSKFARAFNFQPRVDLTEGLRREVAWYRAEQAKRAS